MSNLYKKIYDNTNIIDYYKYRINKLETENKELNKLLDKDEPQKRIKEAIKILNNSINHYKDYKKNNAIINALEILKGEKNDK